MNNMIRIFENEEFSQIRTLTDENGRTLFCGTDIAKALGYRSPKDAVSAYCKGAVKRRLLTNGGSQNIKFIPEGDVYRLAAHSRLPRAKEFKRWVTKDVLPSIRKNGGYIRNQENLSKEEILANAVLLANNLIAEKDKVIEDLEPKAKYFDELVDNNLLTNFRNTAKELHIPQKVFIQFLIDKGLIYRDKKNRLLPYAKNNKGYFEIKEWCRNDNDAVGIQTFVTPKGRHFLLLLIGGDDTCDR